MYLEPRNRNGINFFPIYRRYNDKTSSKRGEAGGRARRRIAGARSLASGPWAVLLLRYSRTRLLREPLRTAPANQDSRRCRCMQTLGGPSWIAWSVGGGGGIVGFRKGETSRAGSAERVAVRVIIAEPFDDFAECRRIGGARLKSRRRREAECKRIPQRRMSLPSTFFRCALSGVNRVLSLFATRTASRSLENPEICLIFPFARIHTNPHLTRQTIQCFFFFLSILFFGKIIFDSSLFSAACRFGLARAAWKTKREKREKS